MNVRSLVGNRVYIVWAVLVGLTIGSWVLSYTRVSPTDGQAWVAIAIFVLAAFKARLVGIHFMELKDAPLLLRGAFEVFCLALSAVLTGFYLVG
jgi:caa(3)-type oxidase subunit IV